MSTQRLGLGVCLLVFLLVELMDGGLEATCSEHTWFSRHVNVCMLESADPSERDMTGAKFER